MTSTFKQKSRRLFLWAAALFISLFAFRLIYGYVSPEALPGHGGRGQYYGDDFFGSLNDVKKNYASEKLMERSAVNYAAPQGIAAASSQKYEKTASIRSKSSEFEKDEKTIKGKTKAYHAVIQYEQNMGQKGSRQVHLLIGVAPELFDSFYADIQHIGTVKATEITKVDKTNEYMKLNARKASLEKTLQSLMELKARNGQISDYVSLNDKILEIEERIQGLGVELGNFDSENEFCTVKMSLYEGEAERGISIMHRIRVALEWSVTWFAAMVFAMLCTAVLVYCLLTLAIKWRALLEAIGKTRN